MTDPTTIDALSFAINMGLAAGGSIAVILVLLALWEL
jgi:hypothetical protein